MHAQLRQHDDDQAPHSRALGDNELVGEVQARWSKQEKCSFVLCRRTTIPSSAVPKVMHDSQGKGRYIDCQTTRALPA